MNTYSSRFQHIHFATSCLFGHTNSNVFSGFITTRSPQSHRGGSSSHLTVARCFSLAVIGGGLGGGTVAPDFKDKTRYTLYVSLGSQISHIATNKVNIKRQYSLHNVNVLVKGK